MRIRMKQNITGTRNGLEWPAVGTVIEIRDNEGADLIAAGLAEEAPDEDPEFAAPNSHPEGDETSSSTADVDPDPVTEPDEVAAAPKVSAKSRTKAK